MGVCEEDAQMGTSAVYIRWYVCWLYRGVPTFFPGKSTLS